MKYAVPFMLVGAALIAAALALGLFGGAGEPRDLPGLRLRDPGGRSFDLASLRNEVWVASFIDAACVQDCPFATETLTGLYDGLPRGVPLVTFVLHGKSLWPKPLAAAEGRRDWIVCQGNRVDADDEEQVVGWASEALAVPRGQLDGMGRGSPTVVIVPIDRRGRPLHVYTLDQDAPRQAAAAVAGAWGDVEFQVTLRSGGSRTAVFYAVVAGLLVVGVVLGRRRLIPIHPVAMAAALLLTVVVLAPAFGYVEEAAAVPFRGSGWLRPLYFSVLATHTVLAALLVLLGSTAIYHAVRGQRDRHRALVGWVAPAWIAVAVSGTVVYALLGHWFAGP